MLGKLLFEATDRQGAALQFFLAESLSPGRVDLLDNLATILEHTRFVKYAPWAAAILERLIRLEQVNIRDFLPVTTGLLALDPDVTEFLTMPEGALVQRLESGPVLAVGHHSLLLLLLTSEIFSHADFELAFIRLRKGMLFTGLEKQSPANRQGWLPLAGAMAVQAFLTEYAWFISLEEERRLTLLGEHISRGVAQGDVADLALPVALFASFRPLTALSCGASLAHSPLAKDPNLLPLFQKMFMEREEERRLEKDIPTLRPISGDSSLRVRNQYEENPYPRWNHLCQGQTKTLSVYLSAYFPEECLPASINLNRPLDVLVAGCGTGKHPLSTFRQLHCSSLLAVDISRTSLAYAQRMAQKHGITGIEFLHADILDLSTLDRRFDYIECVGVLHHMQDPLAGWRVLRNLLKPGGVMHIALYSETARAHIVRTRNYLAQTNIPATPEGIRAFRHQLLMNQVPEAIRMVAKSHDFFSLSGCRDLVFHVQEQRYTLPRLRQELDILDLQLIGFIFPFPSIMQAYKQKFPSDPCTHNLDNWEIFEKENEHIFTRMYYFFCVSPL